MYPTETTLSVAYAMSYTIPKLYDGKESYIGFYAFDPALGKLRRKKIKLNHIKSTKERKMRSKEIIVRLSQMLATGWCPWVEAENAAAYALFEDVCAKFLRVQDKLYDDNLIEKDSWKTFRSNLKIVAEYNKSRENPIKYCYQYDKSFVVGFLDYMYESRGVSPRTRDNYLNFIKKLSGWMLEKDYIKSRPEDAVKKMGKKKQGAKKRKVLEAEDLTKLCDYLQETDKHYLLSVYLIYYCCIRPKELSWLQLKHFNLVKQTIIIPAEFSKNDMDGVVTVPEHVIKLMLELRVLDNDPNLFLFSTRFQPGQNHVHCDQFRKKWNRIRPELGFPEEYQYYSLKDTGITTMLSNNINTLAVRDQARHHSIEMTNAYTPAMAKDANPVLKRYK